MSVNSKMTAIADEIRELSGTTGTIGLDAMATKLDDVNDEVASQAELIEQIVSALDGKAGGGEDVTTEINAYTTKLASLKSAVNELKTELQGKASGGSGGAELKTCTLTITTDSYMKIYGVCATTFVNGTVSSVSLSSNHGVALATPYVIENVLVNSAVFVQSLTYSMIGITTNGVSTTGAFYADGILTFKVNEDADNATIYLYDDD